MKEKLVQIGKTFYVLNPLFRITTTKQLKETLDEYDVYLLKKGDEK